MKGSTGDGLAQAGGDLPPLLQVGVLQDHHELLAPVAADAVEGAHGASQAAGDPLQYRIAHQVAIAVIDLLEVIQVGHHQAQGVVIGQVLHGLFQQPDDLFAVIDACQGIMVGLLAQVRAFMAQVLHGVGQGLHFVVVIGLHRQVEDRREDGLCLGIQLDVLGHLHRQGVHDDVAEDVTGGDVIGERQANLSMDQAHPHTALEILFTVTGNAQFVEILAHGELQRVQALGIFYPRFELFLLPEV